jgi:hypothetical protein
VTEGLKEAIEKDLGFALFIALQMLLAIVHELDQGIVRGREGFSEHVGREGTPP